MSRAVKETIILTASYYNRQLSEQVLEMYIEDLADLDPTAVIAAYRAYRRNPKNLVFPLPAQIRALVAPDVDPESAAREIAARITGAITKFGWCNATEARAFIGEVGWGIVERQGGWMHLCQNHGVTIQPSAFQAQVRDQAASALKFPAGAMNQALRIVERTKAGEMQSIGELLGLPPGPSDDRG
jgi:hypothetical protein